MSYLSILDSLSKKGKTHLDDEPVPNNVSVEQIDENTWRGTAKFETNEPNSKTPEPPLAGMPKDDQVEPSSKPKKSALEKEWGKFQKQGMKRYLGPHGSQAADNAIKVADAFNPVNSVTGAIENSAKTMEAIKEGRYGEGAANFGHMLADIASVAPTASVLAKGGKETVKQASKVANAGFVGHNTPKGYKRTLEQDYPHGAKTDGSGNLTHDIDGRPLSDRGRIAGRARADQGSRGIGPEEFDDITMASTGSVAKRTPLPPETRGQTNFKVIDRKPTSVELADDLKPYQVPIVYGHEVGHVIDQYAGEIPTKGLSKELKEVYNTLNNPQKHGKAFTPEHNNYVGEDIPREYMAEAIRAYMENPDYLKTVAPNAAARIRKYVNSHPELRKIIQFNSVGGAAVLDSQYNQDE